MKSGRRSFPHSTLAFQRRLVGKGDHTPNERDEAADVLRFPIAHKDGKGANKPPSNLIDREGLLHLAQQLYAHALTLQEMIWSEGRVTYEAARPKYDRQAAQQFEVFCQAVKQPPGFRKRGASVFG